MQTQTPRMGARLNQSVLMNWKKGNFNCSSSRSLHTQSREDGLNCKAFGLAVVVAMLEISYYSLLTQKLGNAKDNMMLTTPAFECH